MDLAVFWSKKMEVVLFQASWVRRLRDELGLEGMSPVWSDVPAWYFWLRGLPGSYRLSLADAFQEQALEQTVTSGVFSVKYYPKPGDRFFHSFSPEETAAVQGQGFDLTNTPRFESQKDIPDGLFTIASLECTVNDQETWYLLSLDSQDTLRTVSLSEKQGRVIRSVPGWHLGYQLFERLTALHAFIFGLPPTRVALLREPGFESRLNADSSIENCTAEDLQRFNLLVLFNLQPEDRDTSAEAHFGERLQTEQGRVEMDLSFNPHDRSGPCLQGGRTDWVSRLWWRACQEEVRSGWPARGTEAALKSASSIDEADGRELGDV